MTSSSTEGSHSNDDLVLIPVWDWVVRVGHWLLAGSFLLAYVTAESESLRLVHVTSGLVALAVVLFRVVWGVVGPKTARFSRFMTSPARAWGYLKSLLETHPEHHTGHNPAGGWAVLGLLTLTASTAALGWAAYNDIGGRWSEEGHELFANLSLVLVGLHVAAVVVSSLLHRENLIRPMFTGKKRGHPSEAIGSTRGLLAAVLLCTWAIGFALYWR